MSHKSNGRAPEAPADSRAPVEEQRDDNAEQPDRPTDGPIIDYQGGDGNAATHQHPEVRYRDKLRCLSRCLLDTWKLNKALVAIPAYDTWLLRPVFKPLVRHLKAMLRLTGESIRDMNETEPSKGEMLLSLEREVFEAWNLTRALEMIPMSSDRLCSVGAPLLRELETTLRSVVDMIDRLDAPVGDRPIALPPERDGHAASQPVANDHGPEAPAPMPEPMAAAPSGTQTAATNGRMPAPPADGWDQDHREPGRTSGIVRYLPLDDLGEVRLDLDECPRYFPNYLSDLTDEERDNPPPMHWMLMGIYLTPEGRWVAHRVCTGPLIVHPDNELFQEVSLAAAIEERPDIRKYVNGIAAPNCCAPEAPADRPEPVAAAPSGNGTLATNGRANETAATNGRTSETPAEPTPPARALAAAYDLQREGKPISLNSACERSGVDRKHLRDRYPETVAMIRRLAQLSRPPRPGMVDPRTGNRDAVDDPED